MLIVGDSFHELVSKVDVWIQHIYLINVLLYCALSLHGSNVLYAPFLTHSRLVVG